MSVKRTNKRLSNRAKIESSHFVSDVGCAHVYLTNGCWLPLDRLIDELEGHASVATKVMLLETDSEALSEAVRIAVMSKMHVYPIAGSTLLRLIDAEETA